MLLNISAHQKSAVRRDVIGEWNLSDISDGPSDQQTPEERSHADSAVPFIRRVIVRVALGIVEFLLLRLYINGPVGDLTEINFRALQGNFGFLALHRHVRQDEFRRPFFRESTHGAHRDSVPVRVRQPLAHPVLRSGCGQLR